MILVGPSLGASVAIDFTVHYPEAVSNLPNYILPFNSNTLQYAFLSFLAMYLKLYSLFMLIDHARNSNQKLISVEESGKIRFVDPRKF